MNASAQSDQGSATLTALARLVEGFPDPAFIADHTGTFIAASPTGSFLGGAIREGRMHELREAIIACARIKQPQRLSFGLDRTDGVKHFEFTLTPFTVDGETVAAAFGREVTLDRMLTQALVNSRRLLKDIDIVSNDFGWETDANGRFAYVSVRGALGYTATELFGRSPRDLAADNIDLPNPWPFSTPIPVDRVEVWLCKKDGTPACFEISSRPVFDDNGRQTAVRGGARDVTERKQAQAALQASMHELAAANFELDQAFRQIRGDLRAAARSIEQQLPPPLDIEGLKFNWIFEPSSDVGGDIFDFVYQPLSTRVVVYQIDVAGHGVPAALSSVTLQALVTGVSKAQISTGGDHLALWLQQLPSIADALNDRFIGRMGNDGYFTMLYCTVDSITGIGAMVQAGHPSPLMLESATGIVRHLGESGFPLALLPDVTYEPISFQMQPGDRLVIFSDGIDECLNSAGESFGAERLEAWLLDTAGDDLGDAVETLRTRLHAWKAAPNFPDDISLLVIEKTQT